MRILIAATFLFALSIQAIGAGDTIPMLGIGGRIASGEGPPATPCNAGQLDFSVATGCNLTWYITVMK